MKGAKQEEIGEYTFFNVKRKEIGRVRLSDWTSVVVSIVNDEHLDLRLWIDSDDFIGWSKRALRFYMLAGHWKEFKELMDKVDEAYEAYQNLLELSGIPDPRVHDPILFGLDKRNVTCKI